MKYILQVPLGKAIHLNEKSRTILDDVPNVTNMYDGNMVNKTWLMTRNGLVCPACPPENGKRNDDD